MLAIIHGSRVTYIEFAISLRRRGLAHYTISSVEPSRHHHHKLTQVAAGKLLVSDEEADR